MTAFHLVQVFVSLFFLHLFIANLALYLSNKKASQVLRKAKSLSAKSALGEYVKVNGRVNMPVVKTPYLKTVCSYWKATVKAEFTVKRKKPAKGMETITSVLSTLDSTDMPLIMVSDNVTVQLCFNMSMIRNMHSKTVEQKNPPQELASLSQLKYKHYIIEEQWLADGEELTVWGVVVDKNAHCISLSSNGQAFPPCLAYRGNPQPLFKQLDKKTKQSMFLFLWLSLCSISLWSWIPAFMDDFIALIILSVIALVVLFFLKRKIDKPV